jgi:hypothetical protein
MGHVPMCKVCGEYEAGTFYGGDVDFCSDTCADRAHGYMIDAYYEDMAAQYDDDPSPYAGTYSEE